MKKKILLWVLIITSIMTIGCSNKVSKEKDLIDSVIIDEDTRKTVFDESEISVSQISKVRIENEDKTDWGTFINGKVGYYEYSLDYSVNYEANQVTQFPKHYLETFKIGEITSEKDANNLNIINWEEKDIKGHMLVPLYVGEEIRIFKDDKVYKFNEKGELVELKAYETLIKEKSEDLNRFESHGNGKLDLHCIGEEDNLKIAIVDTEKDEYYEFNKDDFPELENCLLWVLGIDNRKIFLGISNQYEGTFTMGYIENNKFYNLFPQKEGIEIIIPNLAIPTNNVLVSRERILFSGIVEGINGIWNYDIKNKKLVKVIDLEENEFLDFYINKDKNKIFIKNFKEGSTKYNFSIANINEELELSNLSNLTNIYSEDQKEFKGFVGWSQNGKEFYLKSFDNTGVFYEVYRVNN